ncbi:hypothetical protein Lal_00037679 [Lupinus albus]|nr:hypothetical protein Lal_00037679 [Lupinus albus]
MDELRKAVEEVELVDGHAHNIVPLDSTFPFIRAFTGASGDALTFSPHSLSFKFYSYVRTQTSPRNLKDIAELYGCESTLQSVEDYRRVNGIQSICSTCFKTARISTILIDDGFEVDKMHYIEWHKSFSPLVGRILRIERVAEQILEEGDVKISLNQAYTHPLTRLLNINVTAAGEIYGFKSIAAYYSGLEINTNVTKKDAEEGLTQVLAGGKPVCIANKNVVDYIFLQSLEIAQSYDLPVQIHTG